MGSVNTYQTTEGKRYRVIYRKPNNVQTQKRGFHTKKEAELFLANIEVKKASGEFMDASAAKVTIRDLGDAWLAGQTHLKPSSLRPVQIAWRLHVEPVWGGYPVGMIRHSDVQAWISAFTPGRSATTVLRVYGVLAAILDVAVRDRRIPSNPARGVNLPRKVKNKHVYLSHQQVQSLADNSGKHAALIFFLAYTGLRWGEATALRIRDIDFERRRASVHQNAVSVSGTIFVGTPKSHEARTVPYPEFFDDYLLAICQRDGIQRPPNELLFGSGTDHVRQPDRRRGWWVSALKKTRLEDPTFPLAITIHDLRHTAASLSISAGANVKAIQRMLGHASAAMTLDTYADLFDDDLNAVAVALNHAKINSIVAKTLPRS